LRQVLELHHIEAGNSLKVAEIAGGYAVVKCQGRYSDQQIGKWKSDAFSLALTIDLAYTKSNRHRDRMDGQGPEQFLNEVLAPRFALCCVGTGCTVGQFDQRDNGDSYVGISRCAGDRREHLPCILPLPLGLDQHAGIED
jgi:hypothetical protein